MFPDFSAWEWKSPLSVYIQIFSNSDGGRGVTGEWTYPLSNRLHSNILFCCSSVFKVTREWKCPPSAYKSTPGSAVDSSTYNVYMHGEPKDSYSQRRRLEEESQIDMQESQIG